LNSRKPIFLMIVVGLAAILVLSFTPYALLSRARQTVETIVQPVHLDGPALKEVELESLPAPFDMATWFAGRGVDPDKRGALIETLDGKQVFAAHNADTAFNPASLIKLATSLVALRRLGKDYRFETRIYVEGPVDNAGALRGRLVIAGNDPTFGDVAAAMIAARLKESGVKSVPEEIAVTPEFTFNFSGKPDESAQRFAKVAKLTPKTYTVAATPTGSPALVLRSYPLRAILLYMNAHSSNFVAERLGNLVGGPAGVQDFLVNELKLPADQVTLTTTSGLEHNRLTPRGLVTVIRALNEEANRQGLKLEEIMAVASDDWGTLRRRFVGTPLEGAVIGKTGTLVHDDGGMASLGGIISTQKSGKLCFVMLSQGSTVWENKQKMDELLVEIVTSRDTPVPIGLPDDGRHQLERTELLISDE
jgi:D-alanyl-D-alanine carboxypeptidase/D-alanyl-D-alanine-endopeptidase (penicillin-binding protein 4)